MTVARLGPSFDLLAAWQEGGVFLDRDGVGIATGPGGPVPPSEAVGALGDRPAGTVADITEHMDVIGSCGNKLGKVDHVEGSYIKLTKNDSADGQHHLIPTSWVSRVDSHVHLSKNCGDAKREWQTA